MSVTGEALGETGRKPRFVGADEADEVGGLLWRIGNFVFLIACGCVNCA
jgi:hypothetical protein